MFSLNRLSLFSLRATKSGVSRCRNTFRHTVDLVIDLAQASIALSTLAASAGQAQRLGNKPSTVVVDMRHASIEFKSERLTLLNSQPPPSPWGPIGGLYKVSDGYVRIHDSFPNHRQGTAKLLGCEVDRAQLAQRLLLWKKLEFEDAAIDAGLCCFALRTKEEWESHPQVRPSRTMIVRVLNDCSRTWPSILSPSKYDDSIRTRRPRTPPLRCIEAWCKSGRWRACVCLSFHA